MDYPAKHLKPELAPEEKLTDVLLGQGGVTSH
jgi:hypothetical protein